MTSAEPAPRVLITSAMIRAAQDRDAAGRPRDRSWHRVPADQAARLLAGAWPLIAAAERERITALVSEKAAELSDHGVQGASAASMTSPEPPAGPLDAITEAANAFLDALGLRRGSGIPGERGKGECPCLTPSAFPSVLRLAISDPGSVLPRNITGPGGHPSHEMLAHWQARAVMEAIRPWLARPVLDDTGRALVEDARAAVARFAGQPVHGIGATLHGHARALLDLLDRIAPKETGGE